jgi:hypothetical protein
MANFFMPRTLFFELGCLILLSALTARADPPAEASEQGPPAAESSTMPRASAPPSTGRGFSVGARSGWAIPFGSLVAGDAMQANFDGMVPLWFDAGYRVSEQFYAGGYFQWGFAFVSDEVCPPALLRCTATDLRFGLDVHWHFKSLIEGGSWAGAFDPWVGVGTGYESTIIRLSAGEAKSHETDGGFEFGNVQLGGDYTGLSSWRIGAFSSLAIAEYLHRTTGTPAGSASYSLPHPAVHLWLTFGARVQYDL